VALCLCALIACSGKGRSSAIYHPDVGPFDENGDYVVALADAPVRKNANPISAPAPVTPRPAAQAPVQAIASNQARAPRPPRLFPTAVQNRRPAPIQTVSAPRSPRVTSGPVLIAQSPRAVASIPPSVPALVAAPAPAVRQAPPQPVQAPAPAPVSQPKPAAPAKKAPVRHVVRSSDTLYGLSRKYGVSVSAIQKANGLRGSSILTGSTLKIPR